jgi:hypothetical protein
MQVLGVQGRGSLINVLDMISHLARLNGASKRSISSICQLSSSDIVGQDRRVSVKCAVRSKTIHVRRLTLSSCLLRSDIPASDLLSFFHSICKHLSLLSQVPSRTRARACPHAHPHFHSYMKLVPIIDPKRFPRVARITRHMACDRCDRCNSLATRCSLSKPTSGLLVTSATSSLSNFLRLSAYPALTPHTSRTGRGAQADACRAEHPSPHPGPSRQICHRGRQPPRRCCRAQ